MTQYVEVTSEEAVDPKNGTKEFLLVDSDGYSVVLFGCQMHGARMDRLGYFRIMMVKEERN